MPETLVKYNTYIWGWAAVTVATARTVTVKDDHTVECESYQIATVLQAHSATGHKRICFAHTISNAQALQEESCCSMHVASNINQH